MEKQHSKPDSSLNFSLLAANPWEHDGRTVTSIRNSLILAEQMGLKTLSKEFGLKCPPVLAHLQSSQLIALQREIAEKNRSLIQIKQAIANHSQEKETAYFTHVDVIENRISMIKELCTDFDLILKNPDVIIHRLQKPYVGDYIEMNAAYHKFAKEVFMQLVSTLNDLSLHLDNITWAANTDFSSSHLEPLLVEVQSLTASMQTSYHTLSQMRKGVELLRNREQDLSDVDISEADSPQHGGATPRNIKGDSEGVVVRPRLVCGGGSSKVKE